LPGLRWASVAAACATMKATLVGITVVCATSFLVFFSYMSMQNLESSLRPGTGTTAVGVLYFAIICGTPLAPKVINALGRKRALVLSACTYVAFIASNLYPVWQVMMPAAVVLGLGGAIFWPTTLSLIKHFSVKHAEAVGGDKSKCLDRFSSAFWGSFQFSQLAGSVMIYLIFQGKDDKGGGGAVERAADLLAVIFTICASVGCLLASLFLEDVDRKKGGKEGGAALADEQQLEGDEGDENGGEGGENSQVDLKFAVRLITSPRSLLMLGVYFYNGLEQGFAWCDFTSGMVLATFGDKAMIGILMLCYAGANAITGSLSAQVSSSRRMTRGLIFYAMASQSACVLLVHLLLDKKKAPLYLVAVVLGAGDALLNTKIGLLIGTDFKGKQHVITVSIWRGVTAAGCAIPFFLSGHAGIATDIAMLVGAGAAAVVLFMGYCTRAIEQEEVESGEQYQPILDDD